MHYISVPFCCCLCKFVNKSTLSTIPRATRIEPAVVLAMLVFRMQQCTGWHSSEWCFGIQHYERQENHQLQVLCGRRRRCRLGGDVPCCIRVFTPATCQSRCLPTGASNQLQPAIMIDCVAIVVHCYREKEGGKGSSSYCEATGSSCSIRGQTEALVGPIRSGNTHQSSFQSSGSG